MKAYRKRAIGNWQQGKSYKGESGPERQYARREVDQAVAEQDEGFRYRFKVRRRNALDRARYWVGWYERVLAEYERRTAEGSWIQSQMSWLRDGLRRAKKRLAELETKDAEVRPQQNDSE